MGLTLAQNNARKLLQDVGIDDPATRRACAKWCLSRSSVSAANLAAAAGNDAQLQALRRCLVGEGLQAGVVEAICAVKVKGNPRVKSEREEASSGEGTASAAASSDLGIVEGTIIQKRPLQDPAGDIAPAGKAARVESQAAEKPDAASTSAAPDSDRDQAGAHLPPALAPAASSKVASLLCPSSLMRAVTCATTAARRMRPAHLQVRVQTTPPLR